MNGIKQEYTSQDIEHMKKAYVKYSPDFVAMEVVRGFQTTRFDDWMNGAPPANSAAPSFYLRLIQWHEANFNKLYKVNSKQIYVDGELITPYYIGIGETE